MLKSYHFAWLSAHPDRTEEWLKERMKDGFHIHHIDRDHSNDDPANLVLIDGQDHMRLHGMKNFSMARKKRATKKEVPYSSWPAGPRLVQKRLKSRLRAAEELLRSAGLVN